MLLLILEVPLLLQPSQLRWQEIPFCSVPSESLQGSAGHSLPPLSSLSFVVLAYSVEPWRCLARAFESLVCVGNRPKPFMTPFMYHQTQLSLGRVAGKWRL